MVRFMVMVMWVGFGMKIWIYGIIEIWDYGSMG